MSVSPKKEFLHQANLRAIALSDFTTAINDAKDEGREEARAEYEIEIKNRNEEIKRLKEELEKSKVIN